MDDNSTVRGIMKRSVTFPAFSFFNLHTFPCKDVKQLRLSLSVFKHSKLKTRNFGCQRCSKDFQIPIYISQGILFLTETELFTHLLKQRE